MTDNSRLQEIQGFREQLQGMLGILDQREREAKEEATQAGAGRDAHSGRPAAERSARAFPDERVEALLEEISDAYKRLSATRRKLQGAESARRDAETKIRVEHKRALEAAKNERTAALYLDSILEYDGYRKLVRAKEQAELDHFDARAEVDRLQLVVRLLRAATGTSTEAEAARA